MSGVSFTGDGGSNQGTTFEAMNLAVVLQVPAIFLFENNGYGEGTAAGYAVGSKDIASRAAAFGMPALKVDGADIFAVYDTCQKAVKHCRAGKGPITIEASITRFRAAISRRRPGLPLARTRSKRRCGIWTASRLPVTTRSRKSW